MKMKKNYKKPMIYFESFALSQNIAYGCSLISKGENLPAYDEETEMTIFSAFPCIQTTPDFTDRVCYHTPTEGWNIFTS